MPWHPDPVYSLGKHGVVGFMRSIAPNLAPEGIAVHTICPGITETGVLGDRRSLVEGFGVPVMEPEAIADVVLHAATSPMEATGSCWVAQHGKAAWAMEFNDVPGADNKLNVPVRARTAR
jgi:NAD(P)-dependent dehydrogenase (short-subunit alcohol dehydrogenase family)